jgi:hypothetical protein
MVTEGFELQDHIQDLQNVQNYDIPNERDVQNEDPAVLLEGKQLSLVVDLQ